MQERQEKQNIRHSYREKALCRRDPKVGAPGVKDDGEILRRAADPNLAKVLRVEEVLERNDVPLAANAITQTAAVCLGAPAAVTPVVPAPALRGRGLDQHLVLPLASLRDGSPHRIVDADGHSPWPCRGLLRLLQRAAMLWEKLAVDAVHYRSLLQRDTDEAIGVR